MARVFVTRPIPSGGLEMLREQSNIELDVFEKDTVIPREELLRRVKGVDVLLSILTDKIDGDVMDAAGSSLKLITNYAVGFDNIDLKAAQKRGIAVANSPTHELTETVADHAAALILALAHRIVETDVYTRLGMYKGWGPQLLLGTDVSGKTLGIIGSGAIGSALAHRLHHGFGVRVLYNDVKKNEKLEATVGARFVSKDELLKNSDFVSIHVPLLPATKHLIDEKALRIMKPTAFLINTSRGPIIDEVALIEALKIRSIAGAGLDVYECEPDIACSEGMRDTLRKLPNVVLTPHTASATREARESMSKQAATNIIAFLNGQIPPNLLKT